MMTAEQLVRDILVIAIEDGVVSLNSTLPQPDPQCRTSGELCRCANVVTQFVADEAHELRERVDDLEAELRRLLSCVGEKDYEIILRLIGGANDE